MSIRKPKKTLYLTSIMMFLVLVSAPQLFAWVHQGDLIINSQADVEVIKNDLKEVTGDLIIKGSDITNLNQLLMLEKVDGNLTIKDTPNLKNLDGLSSLKTVDKKVDVNVQVAAPQFIPKKLRDLQRQKSIK